MSDDLPPLAPFGIPTRDQIESTNKRFALARNPSASPDDPQLDLDAKQIAQALAPVYARADQAYKNGSLLGKNDAAIIAEAEERGDGLLPAASASGYVLPTTPVLGVPIPDGQQGKANGKVYAVPLGFGGVYVTGQAVPVVAVDTGPATDQPASAQFTWLSPPPGLQTTATIQAQADGIRGFIGGADAETPSQLRERLRVQNARPAASGNSADYAKRVMRTPGLAVEQAFVFPGIDGSATGCIVATMRRASPATSRCPTALEIARMTAWAGGPFPSDDEVPVVATTTNPITGVFGIAWSGSPGWADASPWPPRTNPLASVTNDTVPTSTSFTMGGISTAPAAGQTLAFYDATNLVPDPATGLYWPVFRQKRILSATSLGGGKYTITCDTTAGATDLVYTPAVGQPGCPWGASLNLLVQPIVTEMRRIGPGEQLASFFDPTTRQRRDPPPPAWPYVVGNRILEPLFEIAAVSDAALVAIVDGSGYQTVPYTTPAGSPGVRSYLTEPQYLVFFPEGT